MGRSAEPWKVTPGPPTCDRAVRTRGARLAKKKTTRPWRSGKAYAGGEGRTGAELPVEVGDELLGLLLARFVREEGERASAASGARQLAVQLLMVSRIDESAPPPLDGSITDELRTLYWADRRRILSS